MHIIGSEYNLCSIFYRDTSASFYDILFSFSCGREILLECKFKLVSRARTDTQGKQLLLLFFLFSSSVAKNYYRAINNKRPKWCFKLQKLYE